MSPVRAILLHSPGRKPWVNYWNTSISPQGAALPYPKQMLAPKVPLLIGAHIICCLCVPRVLFVPLALSPPWAMQEYRAYGTLNTPEF